MTEIPILIGQLDSPFVRRVAISMHVLDVSFERRTWSVFGDREQVMRVNPLGRVPALMLADEVLIDSAAILDWLDERVGAERALLPTKGLPRRSALKHVSVAVGCAEKAVAIVYEEHQRRPQYRDPDWRSRLDAQLAAGLDWLDFHAPEPGILDQVVISTAVVARFVNEYVPEHAAERKSLARLCDWCESQEPFRRAPFGT